jgi:uncharacterized membrane protein YfcA
VPSGCRCGALGAQLHQAMRKIFLIWFFILLILVFGYFLYSVTRKNKKRDTIKNDPVAITSSLEMALPENFYANDDA